MSGAELTTKKTAPLSGMTVAKLVDVCNVAAGCRGARYCTVTAVRGSIGARCPGDGSVATTRDSRAPARHPGGRPTRAAGRRPSGGHGGGLRPVTVSPGQEGRQEGSERTATADS